MNKPGTIIIHLTEKQQKDFLDTLQKWKDLSKGKKFVEDICSFCLYFPCGSRPYEKLMPCPLYVRNQTGVMTCCDGDWWRWKAAGNEEEKKKYAKKIYLRIRKVLKEWRVI